MPRKSTWGNITPRGAGSVYFKAGLVSILLLSCLSWALPVLAQTWTLTGSMGTDRRHATVTRLNDGRVLIVGGRDSTNTYLASAEIYNPATGQFTPAGSLTTGARALHTATLLQDGRVLVTGGYNAGPLGFACRL